MRITLIDLKEWPILIPDGPTPRTLESKSPGPSPTLRPTSNIMMYSRGLHGSAYSQKQADPCLCPPSLSYFGVLETYVTTLISCFPQEIKRNFTSLVISACHSEAMGYYILYHYKGDVKFQAFPERIEFYEVSISNCMFFRAI